MVGLVPIKLERHMTDEERMIFNTNQVLKLEYYIRSGVIGLTVMALGMVLMTMGISFGYPIPTCVFGLVCIVVGAGIAFATLGVTMAAELRIIAIRKIRTKST